MGGDESEVDAGAVDWRIVVDCDADVENGGEVVAGGTVVGLGPPSKMSMRSESLRIGFRDFRSVISH